MLEPGSVVGGDYRVERKLSEGGMGAVFVSEQLSTGAKRALKIIRPELLAEPKLWQRFEQEAKVTATIASDHVVSVVAAGFDEGLQVPWLAMELLTGETLLHAVTERGSLRRETALTVLHQLAHAMDAAHAVGVVHRDLKPENIFLADARRSGVPFSVKVLDFGIARVVREAQVTHTDSLGTPLWMSPEQCGSGDAVGPWTDVWALGLIAFYILTGRSYWLSATREGTALSLVREIGLDPLVPARVRARVLGWVGVLPADFDAWFARCVCREIPQRYPSFGVAISELEKVLGSAAPSDDLALAATSAQPLSSPAAQPTPLSPPPAVSITNRTVEARPKRLRPVIGIAALSLVFAAVFGARMLGPKKADALVGISARDATTALRSAEVLRRACDKGDGEACGALGHARAFPASPAIQRDVTDAVTLLDKACAKGHDCALLGALKSLAWAGIAKDAAHYFGLACSDPAARSPEALLDCELAATQDATRLAGFTAQMKPLAACAEHRGDLCGLSWLDTSAQPKDLQAAYDRGCDSGSALACNNLAAMQTQGYPGFEPNPTVGKEGFERACAAGEPAACNNLGFILGGFAATPRRGPRGSTLYKLRCTGALQVGCAAWGERIQVVPPGTPVNIEQAVVAFDRACQAGLTTACVNLGAFLYLGRGVTRDRPRAEKLFADMCFRGDAHACGEQGAALLTIRMDHPRDVRAGVGFLERACKAGEDDACAALYAFLLDDPKREKEGVAGLKLLAERGHNGHALAQLYETGGEGVVQNPQEARKIALRMCEADLQCSDAAYYLSRGIGGSKDEQRAIEALSRGCEHDDFASCSQLGARYREGRSVGRDPTRAVELFRRSCDGGDAFACNELSRAYSSADGVSRDTARALELARSACDGGSADGCSTVGVMVADGVGVTKDVDAAVPYLSFGCRRLVPAACAKLTALGKPVPELDL